MMKIPLERALTILTVVLLAATVGVGYLYYQGIGQIADMEQETDSTATRLALLKKSRELAPLSITLKEKEQLIAQAEKGIPLTGSTLSIYDVVTSASQRTGVGLRTVEFVGTEVPSATTSPMLSPTQARPPAPPRATATPPATPPPPPPTPPRYAIARFTVSASGSLGQISKFIQDIQSSKTAFLAPDDVSVLYDREKNAWIVSAALLQVIRSG